LIPLRALQKARAEKTQRHRASDEQRRLATREVFDSRRDVVE
jgi:hypothetical protein